MKRFVFFLSGILLLSACQIHSSEKSSANQPFFQKQDLAEDQSTENLKQGNPKLFFEDESKKYYSQKKEIYALNKDSGKKAWTFSVKENYPCKYNEPTNQAVTNEYDQSILVVYAEEVYLLSKKDGSVQWSYETDGPATLREYSGSQIYLTTYNKLYKLNLSNKKEDFIYYDYNYIQDAKVTEHFIYLQVAEGIYSSSSSVIVLLKDAGQFMQQWERGHFSEDKDKIIFDEIEVSDYSNHLQPKDEQIKRENFDFKFQPPKLLKVPELLKSDCEMTFFHDTIYPIGWSKDGKIAYIKELADQAMGLNFHKFIIQDLKKDEIKNLFSNQDHQDLESQSFSMIYNWKNHHQELVKAFDENKIIETSDWSFQTFPFQYNGDVYDVEFETEKKAVKNGYYSQLPQRSTLFLTSKNKGKKEIYKFLNQDLDNLEEYSRNMIYDIGVFGFLKSPYEDRIAILFYTTTPGWEGPPDVYSLQFIGADLATNFSP